MNFQSISSLPVFQPSSLARSRFAVCTKVPQLLKYVASALGPYVFTLLLQLHSSLEVLEVIVSSCCSPVFQSCKFQMCLRLHRSSTAPKIYSFCSIYLCCSSHISIVSALHVCAAVLIFHSSAAVP